MPDTNTVSGTGFSQGYIDFLWLELTNRCNLRCVHCYAESGPNHGKTDCLERADYVRLISDGYDCGCRQLQFIGGEPTLNESLPELIRHASETGYALIEVFTNLTRLSEDLVTVFSQYRVKVATSVYSDDRQVHDRITLSSGSWHRTIGNLSRIVDADIPVRVGVIEMEENSREREKTIQFLRSIGVDEIGSDVARPIGRAGQGVRPSLQMLCGACAGRTLCVGSDGQVSPCIMSKAWSFGSVLDQSLTDLVVSDRLATLRGEIYRAVVEPQAGDRRSVEAICTPKTCSPYDVCRPSQGPGPCGPSGCNPCYPKG